MSNFQYPRFGAPVAIGNGWQDDRGPSDRRPARRGRILVLFAERGAVAIPEMQHDTCGKWLLFRYCIRGL
jgi:hypothetical protein